MERFALHPGPSAALVLIASERTDALGETNIPSMWRTVPAYWPQVWVQNVISS